MTKAKFFYEKSLFSKLEISGHSGYAEYGSDIVCSGISSAVLTSINLIDKYTKNYQLEQDEDKGYLCFILNDLNDDKNILLIIENLIEVLEQIESSYPKNLKITIKK